MGVRYRNTFYSIAGVLWKVDIYDSTFSGAVSEFKTEAQGFGLAYKGVTERLDPIMASTLTVPVVVENSTIEAWIDETMTAQEERFTVMVYRGATLEWVGILLPDQVQKEDIAYPFIVDLTFADGLARLKDIDYNNSGVMYSGRETILAHLIKILGKTGVMSMYASGDSFLHTCVNWYEDSHVYSNLNDPLVYTDLGHSIFYEYDDQGNLEYKKASEVLEMILRTFNAQIKMTGGKYVVMQPQEHSRLNTYFREYNKTGGYVSKSNTNKRITPLSSYRKAGGASKYYAPLKKVIKTYKPKVSPVSTGSILPVQTNYYTTPVDFLNFISEGISLQVGGSVREKYSIDLPADPIQLFSKWKMKVILTPTGAGSTYYLTNKNGYYEWSTTSTDYAVVEGPVYGGLEWDMSWAWAITTPLTPTGSTYTGSFLFDFIGLYRTNNVYYDYVANGDFYNASFSKMAVIPDLTATLANCDDIVFTATNVAAGGGSVYSTLELKLPDTLIGDGPQVMHLGKLRVSNGFTWTDSSLWGVHNSTTRANINQLCVDQNLAGQRIPTEKYTGAFISSTLSAIHSVVMGSRVFVPTVINIMPATDEVSGEWFNCIIPPL